MTAPATETKRRSLWSVRVEPTGSHALIPSSFVRLEPAKETRIAVCCKMN